MLNDTTANIYTADHVEGRQAVKPNNKHPWRREGEANFLARKGAKPKKRITTQKSLKRASDYLTHISGGCDEGVGTKSHE
jgi:hypothetical protein